MSLVHPVARARGHGSAKSGVHHWWMQRLTAIALLPLTLWTVFSVVRLAGSDYEVIRQWVGDPLNGSLLIAWIATALHHAQLGLQVVIEDYVHVPWQELGLLVASKLLAALAGIVAVVAILRVVFGG